METHPTIRLERVTRRFTLGPDGGFTAVVDGGEPRREVGRCLASRVGGRPAAWIESFKAQKETFTADSLPTREAVMSVLRTFEAVGQIPNATKMDPDGLVDTRFVKKALERK
jgi:hypothetical protein